MFKMLILVRVSSQIFYPMYHSSRRFFWPILQPGENEFSVITDQGVQDWELIYFERFGGL